MTQKHASLGLANFEHLSVDETLNFGPQVTFVIRKDAPYATDKLIEQLRDEHWKTLNIHQVLGTVGKSYARWGRTILNSFAQHLDYASYGKPETEGIHVAFYSSDELANRTIQNAYRLTAPFTPRGVEPLLVSLDDMILREDGSKFPEIAFSRLFDLDGTERDYIARPGHKPVDEQIRDIAKIAGDLRRMSGQRTPIVLLEDNVRRAKMLNWVIDLMDKNGAFEHADLVGISTSFCNANHEELSKINHRGRVIPVKAVKDWDNNSFVDVATTRDLMFDGFVVEHEGTIGRLPGVFMDVAKRFKIAKHRADDFRREALDANIAFCEEIEDTFSRSVPLKWFEGGEIISKASGIPDETPMKAIMHAAKDAFNQKKAATGSALSNDLLPQLMRTTSHESEGHNFLKDLRKHLKTPCARNNPA